MTEPLQAWGVATGLFARPGMQWTGRRAFSGPPLPWWPEHTLAMLALPGAVHTWVMESVHMDQSVLRPEAVTIPVVVMHGTVDRMGPFLVAEDLHRRLPESRLVPVEGGSHMLPNTHADLVVDEVRRLAGRP